MIDPPGTVDTCHSLSCSCHDVDFRPPQICPHSDHNYSSSGFLHLQKQMTAAKSESNLAEQSISATQLVDSTTVALSYSVLPSPASLLSQIRTIGHSSTPATTVGSQRS